MKAIKSALLVGLACCIAAPSGLARQTSSHSKSSRSSSGKNSRSSATKSRKSKARLETARAKKKDARFIGAFEDLPPEDLPAPESDAETDGDQQ